MAKTKLLMHNRKNVNIDGDTYERLKKRGEFGESFDELINRLLDLLEKYEKQQLKK